VQVIRPVNDRQTRAFAGDWVIKTETGWKVYTHKAYKDSFDMIPEIVDYTPVLEEACS